MIDTGTDQLLCQVSDGVALITLNRPDARNALSSEVLRKMPEAMRIAEANNDVDVLVLTGTDPAFTAGLDLKELGSTGGNLGSGSFLFSYQRLMGEGCVRPGDRCIMMTMGPGSTIETALLHW